MQRINPERCRAAETTGNTPSRGMTLNVGPLKPEQTLYFNLLSEDLQKKLTSYFDDRRSIYLSEFSLFPEALAQKPLKKLSQAIIDDDRQTVKNILEINPKLLLLEPHNLVIESQYTWQKFIAENALTMAVKRKQINMIELLLPYYARIEDQHAAQKAKQASLSAWAYYDIKKYAEGKEEIVVPVDYATYAQSLIDVFRTGIVEGKLSERCEDTLSLLFNTILLPKTAVKLDNYIDVELLLIAIYQAYQDILQHNKTLNFLTMECYASFCIRVIGLVQSALSPETAKIFCEGVRLVKDRKIEAITLKLLTREAFYRSSRDSRSGLGFEYLCNETGTRACLVLDVAAFEKIMIRKNNHYAAIAKPTVPDRETRCVIS